MIATAFEFLAVGPIESTTDWSVAAGSPSGITLNSTQQAVVGAASCKVINKTAPDRANQSAEIGFTFDPSPSSDYTGCFVRYKDANNYVLAQVAHSSPKSMTVVECIAGSSNTLFTILSPGTSLTGACRIEVIGKRVRAWYEAGPVVQDRPPDMATDLSGDQTIIGNWGFYMSAGGANGMAVNRFAASGLPTAVMPPPQITAGTTANLNLTPVSVTLVNPWVGGMTEWEVHPRDPLDFPEAYRDRTDATVNPHILWVRPGYSYDFRARQLLGTGPGAWTPFVTFSTGAKSASSAPILTNIYFPAVVPDYVLEGTTMAEPLHTVSNTGHDHVASQQRGSRRSWKLTFAHRESADYQLLIDFFEFVKGRDVPFVWTAPESAEQFNVRFDADDYEITYDDQNTASPVASVKMSIAEVELSAVVVMPISLSLDPATYS